jgi:hypothetical protein
MGTWGAGHFESDAALDRIGELIDSLGAEITELLEEDDFGIDEGFDEAVALVEVVRVIHTSAGTAPPRETVVNKWRKRLLKVFDDQIEDMDPAEGFAKARRAAIVKTFDELAAASRAFWKK